MLKVGDELKDNDPRVGVRIVEIVALLPDGVEVFNRATSRTTRISAKYIYTDEKLRRTGFSLLRS